MFDESQNYINSLKKLLTRPPTSAPLTNIKNKIDSENSRKIDEIQRQANNLIRENTKISEEIKKMNFFKEKQEEQLSIYNSEKCKQAKLLYNLEDELAIKENLEQTLINKIEKNNETLRNLCMPTVDDFYLQVMKGFDVAFLDGRIKVKNFKKTEVAEFDMKDEYETCNDIWEHLN